MRKFIFLFLFILISNTCFADHWVFIRLEDRSGVTLDQDAGRSKRGDIVQITNVVEGEVPTPDEQSEWMIVRVVGLTTQEIESLMEEWNEGSNKAFRRKKILLNQFTGVKRGIYPTVINKNKIINARNKTRVDLLSYNRKRIFYAYFKRPIIKLVNSLDINKAYAATQVISKICATGSNCTDENYNTLQAWEDAKDGDLVTADQIQTAELYDDDGDISGRLSISGSTVDSTRYMEVTAPVGERHTGTRGTGATMIYTGTTSNIIEVGNNFTRISYIEVDCGSMTGGFQFGLTTSSTGGWADFHHNLIYDGGGEGIKLGSATSTEIYQNIILSAGNGITTNSSSTSVKIYQNTIINSGTGINAANTSGTDVNAKNNLVLGGGTNYSGTYNTNSRNNGCDDTTCPDNAGANPSSENLTIGDEITVTTSGSEDIHLIAGATSINNGVDLGSNVWIAVDVDDRNRDTEGDVWDIGAHEYVVPGTGIKNHGTHKFYGDIKFL